MWKIASIFCIIGAVSAQTPDFGSCPEVKTVPTLDLNKYAGKWFESHRYFAVFELGAKCVVAEYTPEQNGTVKVVNSQISGITGKPASIEGTAQLTDMAEPGKLKVTFPSVPVKNSGDYWVLGTDYTSYAVVWDCVNLKFANLQFAWILTREQIAPQDVIQKALSVFTANNLSVSKLSKTEQNDCPVN